MARAAVGAAGGGEVAAAAGEGAQVIAAAAMLAMVQDRHMTTATALQAWQLTAGAAAVAAAGRTPVVRTAAMQQLGVQRPGTLMQTIPQRAALAAAAGAGSSGSDEQLQGGM